MKYEFKLFTVISLLLFIGGLLPCAAQQGKQSHLVRRFEDGNLKLDFAGKELTRFEFHQTNSSGNFCDIEASRNSPGSRWKIEANLIRIELAGSTSAEFKSNGDILIRKKGSNFEIIFEIADSSQICGLGRQLPSRIEVYKTNRRTKVKVIE